MVCARGRPRRALGAGSVEPYHPHRLAPGTSTRRPAVGAVAGSKSRIWPVFCSKAWRLLGLLTCGLGLAWATTDSNQVASVARCDRYVESAAGTVLLVRVPADRGSSTLEGGDLPSRAVAPQPSGGEVVVRGRVGSRAPPHRARRCMGRAGRGLAGVGLARCASRRPGRRCKALQGVKAGGLLLGVAGL